MADGMKAPFPYFGGKSKIAATVWSALGTDIDNYIEPFAGSLATLLLRPEWRGKLETVNDYDGLLANAWRAIKHDPESVAEHADNPVNECDLHARHLWLVGHRNDITARLMGDPDWFDAKAAGWWIWGACVWIGSGWCSGRGPWIESDGEMVDSRQLPHLADNGTSVNRQLPRMANNGVGINRKLPHLTNNGAGVNRKLPRMAGNGAGVNRKLPRMGDSRREFILTWFSELSDRLRHVRVACGDFERVLGPTVTTRFTTNGVFLDPPYDAGDHEDPYHTGSGGVSTRARNWAILHGNDPKLRIVLAGYTGEHDGCGLEILGWRQIGWKATGGYGNLSDKSGRANAHREVLWISPNCLDHAA